MHSIKRKLGGALGLDQYFWKSSPNGLYSVNFHRIGDVQETQFDPCVYSCSTEELDLHLQFFKENFSVVSLDEVAQLSGKSLQSSEKYMCITFDDGYIDNYNNALPLLKKHNLKASFFIATGLIGNKIVPWWDKVAFLIKKYSPERIHLSGWPAEITRGDSQRAFIRNVLSAIKQSKQRSHEQISLLEQAFNHNDGYPQPEFMEWHHLKEMLSAGMELGAHSHNHDILTKLSEEELLYELSHSKRLLESNLTCDITAFSYPVGNSSTYNQNVIDALKDNGYQLAFNFLEGVNKTPLAKPYDLHRFSIAPGMSNADLKRLFSYARTY